MELKNPGGRPTSLTPEVKRIILESLRAGAYISTACTLAGITEKTFYNWVRRGQSEDPEDKEFSKFLQSVGAAMAEAETESVGRIRLLGKWDWRALAWWLSRRHRKRWGAAKDD